MNAEELKDFLDEKVVLYNNKNFIDSDPVQIPHLYSQKEDIEIAGLRRRTISLSGLPTRKRNFAPVRPPAPRRPTRRMARGYRACGRLS